MELVTSWMEQGIAKGIEQGIEQGRQEGELGIIVRLLARRIGPISPELQARVQQLAVAHLDDLGETLPAFTSAQDLEDWLQEHER